MEQYTPIERAEIVQLYIENNFSIVKTQRAWQKNKKVKSAPSTNTIKRLHRRLLSSGTVANPRRPNKKRPRRSEESIAAEQASIEAWPRISGVRHSAELGIPRTTLRRILRDDFKLFPYKIQVTHRLLPTDKPCRLEYANFVVRMAQSARFLAENHHE
nr:unnamed protein product [Callosobruchus chinensis]